MLKLNLATHDVAQAILEGLRSEVICGATVGQHFLKTPRPVTDARKDSVIEAQEMKSKIPTRVLPAHDHPSGELHHVVVDAQGHVSAGCVAVYEMAVLVRQHSAKRILIEVIKD